MAPNQAASWLGIPLNHPFGLETLPYGSFSTSDRPGELRAGVAIGDYVLDLSAATARLLSGRAHLFSSGKLDAFLAAGDGAWAHVRAHLVAWLSDDAHRVALEDLLVPAANATLHLPFTVADYVDFYASEQHAANVGRIFRPDAAEPLPPNWRHLPLGYHGRAGTVIVSGTPVRRPAGQSWPAGAAGPAFGPSGRLDFEAELGFVVGVHSMPGEPVPASRFAEHVFGVCLVNDWSARDIQSWEYVPLGPFLGKSFGTTVSPWVVPLAALEHARVRPPSRDTELLPYLTESADWGLDISYEVTINGHVVSRPPYATMHWSPAQMLAHMTVNGAALRTGDLYASGTVSGPLREQRGSLIELAWNGQEPVRLPDGSSRAWLEDGDEVVIAATARGPGEVRIGLGQARGLIVPAVVQRDA
ncbi:MAG: fumarylacetoacetase [Streptosporangiaceae bacterium]|jgi:fumarylacetoacetase